MMIYKASVLFNKNFEQNSVIFDKCKDIFTRDYLENSLKKLDNYLEDKAKIKISIEDGFIFLSISWKEEFYSSVDARKIMIKMSLLFRDFKNTLTESEISNNLYIMHMGDESRSFNIFKIFDFNKYIKNIDDGDFKEIGEIFSLDQYKLSINYIFNTNKSQDGHDILKTFFNSLQEVDLILDNKDNLTTDKENTEKTETDDNT